MTGAAENREHAHFLDRRGARFAAVAICAAMLVLLGIIHRNGPADESAGNAGTINDAFAACRADRHGAVDQMVAEGVIGPDKEALFKSRADALCRDQNPG